MKTKKSIAVVLAFALAFTMCLSSSAFAAESEGYLSLGADLSEAERNTVMDLMGVDDPDNYEVLYVTNADEHKYLDSYVSSDQIGSRALSSVLIKEKSGDDIDVEIHNIGYCTEGMYRNALQTAGVEGADVVVAGPFEISGTAALVGTIKAYEQMSGETVDDEVIEGAVDELTTTGEVGEEIGDKEAAEGIVSQVKEDLADNPDMTDEEIETQTIGESGRRKSKAPCMVLFCAFEQMHYYIELGERYGFKHYIPLVFRKNFSAQVLKANMKIVGNCEYGLVLYKDKLPKFNNEGRMIFNCFEWPRDTSTPKVHPTQKPVPLLEEIIRIFTDEGDVVIDPCAGSGTTLRAAMQIGRRAYGFEIKKDFFKLAQEKILRHYEPKMF